MAGSNWTTQNKVRPGVYINFETEAKPLGTVGQRGIVTMPLSLSWGAAKTVQTIHAGDNIQEVLGYDITSPKVLLIKEVLKRAKTVLLYRLNTGVKATVVHGSLTVTAKHGGIRGNDLTLVVQTNIEDAAKFDVKTMLAGEEIDSQTVANIDGLVDNAWVDFSGTGSLTTTAGLPLTGGGDGSITNQDHADYLEAIEVHEFSTMALPSNDADLKAVYVAFAKRLREDDGRKIQVVLENYPVADDEGVISVKNGVILADGTTINSVQATAWVAGATAAAQVNQSLTYQAYDDAVDTDTRYTNAQIEAALQNGEFVFVLNNGRAIVEKDINTLKSFTPMKGKQFSKNRVVRVLDGLANDFKRIFETFYIGKVDNNVDGLNIFRNECINQAVSYQNINAIQSFNAQSDIIVQQGTESDSVYVEVTIKPVDSIEKVYMKVKVK